MALLLRALLAIVAAQGRARGMGSGIVSGGDNSIHDFIRPFQLDSVRMPLHGRDCIHRRCTAPDTRWECGAAPCLNVAGTANRSNDCSTQLNRITLYLRDVKRMGLL